MKMFPLVISSQGAYPGPDTGRAQGTRGGGAGSQLPHRQTAEQHRTGREAAVAHTLTANPPLPAHVCGPAGARPPHSTYPGPLGLETMHLLSKALTVLRSKCIESIISVFIPEPCLIVLALSVFGRNGDC